MGDATAGLVCLSFNPPRVEFRGATVTSDAGLLPQRELYERLGLSALIERYLTDARTGHNYQFALLDLIRQSIYSEPEQAARAVMAHERGARERERLPLPLEGERRGDGGR